MQNLNFHPNVWPYHQPPSTDTAKPPSGGAGPPDTRIDECPPLHRETRCQPQGAPSGAPPPEGVRKTERHVFIWCIAAPKYTAAAPANCVFITGLYRALLAEMRFLLCEDRILCLLWVFAAIKWCFGSIFVGYVGWVLRYDGCVKIGWCIYFFLLVSGCFE